MTALMPRHWLLGLTLLALVSAGPAFAQAPPPSFVYTFDENGHGSVTLPRLLPRMGLSDSSSRQVRASPTCLISSTTSSTSIPTRCRRRRWPIWPTRPAFSMPRASCQRPSQKSVRRGRTVLFTCRAFLILASPPWNFPRRTTSSVITQRVGQFRPLPRSPCWPRERGSRAWYASPGGGTAARSCTIDRAVSLTGVEVPLGARGVFMVDPAPSMAPQTGSLPRRPKRVPGVVPGQSALS